MATREVIAGIDLGTTNSSIGVFRDGRPTLIDIDGSALMPSVVGLSPTGEVLVGRAARNQRHLYPERTLRSIKRRMGEDVLLKLGDDKRVTPVEASAMILTRLRREAEAALGEPVRRAVITVPAYFSDAQRNATREAGEIAGFTVERILNEPTAAALAYSGGELDGQTCLVYDLGGGTFDVSIVRLRDALTEVLASHGDTKLGGDDFDARVTDWLREQLGDVASAVEADLHASARLGVAAERAKITLSNEPYVRVIEEHLIAVGGTSRHLDVELTRPDYEGLVADLLEGTIRSVDAALQDADMGPDELGAVLLVGGSTRTPAVGALLRSRLGHAPRMDVDPDRAVAIGATLLAARLAGQHTESLLVDVTPHSFGIMATNWSHGVPDHFSFAVVIPRNTPVPCRRTSMFYTSVDGQEVIDVQVYQGEAEDVRDNLLVGRFRFDGLDPEAEQGSILLCDLALDSSGILHVTMTEKHTGLSKQVTIEDAFRALDRGEIAESGARLRAWMGEGERAPQAAPSGETAPPPAIPALPPAPAGLDDAALGDWALAEDTWKRAHTRLASLTSVDAEEVRELLDALVAAMQSGAGDDIKEQTSLLTDVLFYLED